MPWANPAVLDNGLNAIKNGAIRCVLTNGYINGDTYAQVQAKKVAEVVVASTDFTLANGTAGARTLTFGGKTGASAPNASATTTAADDLDFVFTNGVDTVLWATEATDMAITSGNPVEFPAGLTYTKTQPVAA